MDINDLIITPPTNTERDADPIQYGQRDTNAQWDRYSDVRVVIQHRFDFESEEITWSFLATKDDGKFVSGVDYVSEKAARKECERRIKRGVFQRPSTQYRNVKRAEVFGPIGEPSEKLAALLADWDAEYSA